MTVMGKIDSRAVSPVIGTVLLVGIVVIAIGIIAPLVLSSIVENQAPNAEFEFIQDGNNLTIVYSNGDALNPDEIFITINGKPAGESFHQNPVLPSDTVALEGFEGESTVQIYWRSASGSSSSILANKDFVFPVFTPQLSIKQIDIDTVEEDDEFPVEVTVEETAGFETDGLSLNLQVVDPDGEIKYDQTIDSEDISDESITVTFGEDGETELVGPLNASVEPYEATLTVDADNSGEQSSTTTFLVVGDLAELIVHDFEIDHKLEDEEFDVSITIEEVANVQTDGLLIEMRVVNSGTIERVYDESISPEEIQNEEITVTFGVTDDTDMLSFEASEFPYEAIVFVNADNSAEAENSDSFYVFSEFPDEHGVQVQADSNVGNNRLEAKFSIEGSNSDYEFHIIDDGVEDIQQVSINGLELTLEDRIHHQHSTDILDPESYEELSDVEESYLESIRFDIFENSAIFNQELDIGDVSLEAPNIVEY